MADDVRSGWKRVSTIDDYCEHCDLPLSTCIHGNPPAPPPEPVRKASPVRTTRAPRAAAGSRGSAAAATPPRARRRTPAEDFELHVVAVLEARGGEASAEEVMTAVGERMAEAFRPGDEEKGPTGELRWRTACRTARKNLADQGRLLAPSPGVWRLT